MTARGVEFLHTWIKNNVTASDTGEAQASILATSCILEAATQRIFVFEMEEDGPRVETVIMTTMARLTSSIREP